MILGTIGVEFEHDFTIIELISASFQTYDSYFQSDRRRLNLIREVSHCVWFGFTGIRDDPTLFIWEKGD
jgi:hypothetical protein